jgi:hypothetical protein
MRAFLLLTLLAGPASAGPATTQLAPWASLAGSCYAATFPDGKARDEHCWTWVYDGAHLRDVHEVRPVTGDGPPYRGEAIYSWDAKRSRVVYRYWNSQGGFSDGTMVQRGDALYSPEERYTGKDGLEQVFRTSVRIQGPEGYETRTETLKDGVWVEAWRMAFRRSRQAP